MYPKNCHKQIVERKGPGYIIFFILCKKIERKCFWRCVWERKRDTPLLSPRPLPSPPPKRTLLVHLRVNREGVFIKPPFFTHYCNKGRSFLNWSKIIDMNWFFSFPGTKFGVFSLWDPSIFKTLTTVTSNTKIDKRKENVYSINILSISLQLIYRGRGSTSP